jgi:hypothetical protein
MKLKKITTGFYKTKDVESKHHGLEERFAWNWKWEDQVDDRGAYEAHWYVRRYFCPEERQIVWVQSESLLYAVGKKDSKILEKEYKKWRKTA